MLMFLLTHPQLNSASFLAFGPSNIPVVFVILQVHLAAGGEHVIFEQIGQLAGSTSYLHAHITVSVTSIEEQFQSYESLLQNEYSDFKTVNELIRHNLGNTSHLNIPDENRGNFSSTKLYMAAVSWTKMAQLHLEDTTDIREHIDALRNMLPDRPVDNLNRVAHDPGFFEELQHRINLDSYVLDDAYVTPPRGRKSKDLPPVWDDLDPDQMDPTFMKGALQNEDQEVPFHFRTSPLHEAAYRHIIKTKVNLGITHAAIGAAALGISFSLPNNTTTASPPNSTLYPPYQPNRRGKRLAGIVALPIAIAATAMGIYNSVQIEFLKTELLEVKDNVKRLFEVLQRFDKELNEISSAIRDLSTSLLLMNIASPSFFDARLTRIENQLRHRLRMATHALQTAQHRRLAIDYLSPKQIRTLFSKLQKRAAEFGCELLIQHHSDLFQIEVSLLFDGRDAHLLVHVPMVPINSLLRLFKLHPFPLPFFEDHFLIPDVQHDVLAVSSNDHRLSTHLSSVDLLGCHRVNQIFMCDRFGVLSRQFNNTCLGSLFIQDFATAQTACKFEIAPVTEKVFQLRKNWFAAFLPGPATIPIKCRNGTVTEKHLGRGSQQFHLSPGCEAYFNVHQVFSDLSIKMPAEILHFEWTWDPLTMVNMLPDKVVPELERLWTFGLHRPALTDLQYLSAQQSQANWSTWSHIAHYVGNAVLIILIIGLALWIGIRCYRWKKSQRRSDEISTDQPRYRRAEDPSIVAAAAARILGANTPAWLRRDRARSSSVPPTAPRDDVRYHPATQSVHVPYGDPHLAVRTEIERQNLIQHLQNEINRISIAPCENE